MGKTAYNSNWESDYTWIQSVKENPSKAYGKLCKKAFFIDKCGISQINSHTRGDSHGKYEKSFKNQAVFTWNLRLLN